MLGNMDAIATLGVSDLQRARRFYEDVLGLAAVGEDEPGVVTYRAGNTRIFVYFSEFAGTNRATAVTWTVGDGLVAEVERLAAAGVVFEHYDMPGLTRSGDVHGTDRMKIAWFKDPDGNFHALVGN